MFFHQVSIGDPDSVGELLFAPAIEPVARAGFPLQARSELLRLALEKALGFLVARVEDYWKVEMQAALYIFDSRLREVSPGRRLDLAGSEKVFDCLLELVLTQLGGRWDSDLVREILEFDSVPIPVVELSQGHRS